MNNKISELITETSDKTVGIAWYDEQSWTDLKKRTDTPWLMDESYEEWRSEAEKAFERMSRSFRVLRVKINIDDLVGWARNIKKRISPDIVARYVGEFISEIPDAEARFGITIEQANESLHRYNDVYKGTCFRFMLARPSEAAPLWRKVIDDFCSCPSETILMREVETAALYYALIGLALLEDTASHEAIVRLSTHAVVESDEILDEWLTECFSEMFVRTYAGDPKVLQRHFEDHSAEEFSRSAALIALKHLAYDRKIAVDAFRSWLEEVAFSPNLATSDSHLWSEVFFQLQNLDSTRLTEFVEQVKSCAQSVFEEFPTEFDTSRKETQEVRDEYLASDRELAKMFFKKLAITEELLKGYIEVPEVARMPFGKYESSNERNRAKRFSK